MKVKDDLERSEEAVEALMPSTSTRVLEMKLLLLGPDGHLTDQFRDFEYVQATLGFGPIQDFFNKIGKEIKKFAKGEYGMNIADLIGGDIRQKISAPNELSGEQVQKLVDDNQAIIDVFLALIREIPELEWDIIALSLGVPRGQIEWFKLAITEPPHRGGLTIDEGFDILKVFVRQNAAAVRRFFEDQGKALFQEIQEALEPPKTEENLSTGGTPSSTTAPDMASV